MSLPWTVSFSFAHAGALGQHASPGRQRQDESDMLGLLMFRDSLKDLAPINGRDDSIPM